MSCLSPKNKPRIDARAAYGVLDPRFLAATLPTRMLWFLHPQDFPWYEDNDAVLGVPEMTKKMGRRMPPRFGPRQYLLIICVNIT